MKVEYSRRALADLQKAAADSRTFGETVADALERRIHEIVAQIARHPKSAPAVSDRPGVHVVPLVRYPYRVFYRVFDDQVRILHIRHTPRRP